MWYRQQQRAHWRTPIKQNPWEWEGTEEEWWNDLTHDNAYQLHYAHYGRDFAYLLEHNPNLMQILSGAFGIWFNASMQMVLLDWGFLDMDVPLTAPDDSNFHTNWISPSHIFKDGMCFQSVYFSLDDSVPAVFDTGATILVSPYSSNFISWEQSTDDLAFEWDYHSHQCQGCKDCWMDNLRWSGPSSPDLYKSLLCTQSPSSSPKSSAVFTWTRTR